jgi:Cytochrome oxidase complex assembly protein 1
MDQPPSRTWWRRNWKWVVPVGCLTPLLLCGGLTTLIFFLVFGTIKSSDVYTEALARAKANEEVKALLGEPIEAGFWVSGSFEVSGPSGKADLAIPISGPKGSATLYAVATKTGGGWQYSTLEVAPQDAGARIDLRSKPDQ